MITKQGVIYLHQQSINLLFMYLIILFPYFTKIALSSFSFAEDLIKFKNIDNLKI